MQNEITESSLKMRLRKGLLCVGIAPKDVEAFAEVVFREAQFSELVGVVGRAERDERNRAAQTARRLGHSQTARVIQEGK